jgi:hypothetical protein
MKQVAGGSYKGKPLEECTKAELIVAVIELGRLLKQAYAQNRRTTDTLMDIFAPTKYKNKEK